ncbi:MAG: hypothetical protein M1827_001645 [Pycnora praestabilis]|nr:MAG: hypothetical protein M1827_001645 [Pycnora praestabilis]
MLLRKPSVLLPSYGGLHSIQCPNQQINTSPCPITSQHKAPQQSSLSKASITWSRKGQKRGYADVFGGHRHSRRADPEWPELPTASGTPTPYQIFNQKKGAPYSKRRFYELVKLYHPDRNSHDLDFSADNLSHTVRLERYRLVVAANNILCDPVKRNAYDRWGAGWSGQPEVGMSRQGWHNAAGEGWAGAGGHHHHSPSQNATWEDWERWYQKDAGAKGPQEPLYFSNTAFISLIVVFAALGGIGQATRVGNFSMNFIEQRNQLHDETSKELRRARSEANGFGNKDERIQSFLKMRDPASHGISDPQEEGYRRLLPAPEVCSSGDIKER